MKKQYVNPTCDVTVYTSKDIITYSPLSEGNGEWLSWSEIVENNN